MPAPVVMMIVACTYLGWGLEKMFRDGSGLIAAGVLLACFAIVTPFTGGKK